MRHGYYAQLVFSNSGNLVAISTGSDACAEHECGIEPLLRALTDAPAAEYAVREQLKRDPNATVTYPDVLESRRITRLPDQLQFIESDTPEGPEAWLGVCRGPITEQTRELSFPWEGMAHTDKNVSGAYSDRDFGIRVRGKKYVRALREFHQAIQAGKVVFGGRFFKRPKLRLGGVLLLNTTYMSDEDRKCVVEEQRKLESNLRLEARNDTNRLHQEMAQASGSPNYHIGYLWVQWADESEKEIRYCLNPGYQVKADYGGYTREQLLAWAKAGYSYHLQGNYAEAA